MGSGAGWQSTQAAREPALAWENMLLTGRWNPKWLQARLDEALAGTFMRAKEAARSAIDHAGLEVRLQTLETRAQALQPEAQLINEYRNQLRNY